MSALHSWPSEENAFKTWLGDNATEVLKSVGIARGQTVVDYGCNVGRFTLPAAGIVGPEGKVYALDIDTTALQTLRSRADAQGLDNIEIIAVQDERDPLLALRETADVVLLFDVLQVVNDKQALMKKIHSMLKQDCILSIFPMHVGVHRALELALQGGLFTLKDQHGMLLNFKRCSSNTAVSKV